MSTRDMKSPNELVESKEDRDIAAEIVGAIGQDRLLDLKFWIEPSAATDEEILETALEWVKDAEKSVRS